QVLDLLLAGEVPGGLEVLADHLALLDEPQSLVARCDLHEHVALATDDRHTTRSVRCEERLGLGAAALRGLLAPVPEELHEHLERLRLPAADRLAPRRYKGCVSRHTPLLSERGPEAYRP